MGLGARGLLLFGLKISRFGVSHIIGTNRKTVVHEIKAPYLVL